MVGPPFTLANASNYLTTPTYEGSGQVVHPDIILFKNGYKSGLSDYYKYILAYCPFPHNNDDWENPCIDVSKDNSTWTQDNVPNPYDPSPARGHNCDVDVVYRGPTDTFYVYYLEAYDAVFGLWRRQYWCSHLRKVVGLTSVSDELSLFSGHDFNTVQLSESYIFDPDVDLFKLWYVLNNDWHVYNRTSSQGESFSTPTMTNIPSNINYRGKTWHPWHLDVQKFYKSKKYWALITLSDGTGWGTENILFFAVSDDGLWWTLYDSPILSPSISGWDNKRIYRSSFAVTDGKIKLWYSACNTIGVWHVGYTETSVAGSIRKGDETLNVLPHARVVF